MSILNLKNATIKVLNLNTGTNSIHLEIYPKNYAGEILASVFGASKENPTVHVRDSSFHNTKKERIFDNIKKMLNE